MISKFIDQIILPYYFVLSNKILGKKSIKLQRNECNNISVLYVLYV